MAHPFSSLRNAASTKRRLRGKNNIIDSDFYDEAASTDDALEDTSSGLALSSNSNDKDQEHIDNDNDEEGVASLASSSSKKSHNSQKKNQNPKRNKSLTPSQKLRRHKGQCPKCRRRTHQGPLLLKTPLTNDQVWNGICIACHPEQVPASVAKSVEQDQKQQQLLLQARKQHPTTTTPNNHGSSSQTFFDEEEENANGHSRSSVTSTTSSASTTVGKVHLPTSMRRAVLESWECVQDSLEEIGMEFFLTLFDRQPHWKDLFRFGGEATTDLKQNKLLQVHATGVMKTVGVALNGLSDMERLIPVLRNLGRIHSSVGVRPQDYDVVYSVLIHVIQKHVGPEKWTAETEQAWQTCYIAIASVMKDPSRHLDVEPAEGWGRWNAVVCAYVAVITPLQLAGFGVASLVWRLVFGLCNVLAVLTCLADASSDMVQNVVKLKTRESFAKSNGHSKRWWFPLKFRLSRVVRQLEIDRWASWPKMDSAIVLSFVLEWLFHQTNFNNNNSIQAWLPSGTVYAVGLVRLVALQRVVHYMRCAELMSLKKKNVGAEYYHQTQLSELFLLLVYMIHLFGCLHCVVAKISLDYVSESSFSPVLHPILEQGYMFNAYMQITYWAFVNVAGIGNYDSVPETSLEIMFSMVVHLLGATLYAIAAGSIFAVLEQRAETFSKAGEGIASLKGFMQDCNIPETSQEAFLSSYLMRNLVPNGDHVNRASSDSSTLCRPLMPEAAETLPAHLTQELNLFSRATAIRNRGIPSASDEFSFVLAETLVENLTLLSGDYLFHKGQQVTRRVCMVDKGCLEIFVDGVSKGRLYPGDIIGVGWLATTHMDSRHAAQQKASLDWLTPESLATADIRAMEPCHLVMGLSSSQQVNDLRRLYYQDMLKVQEICSQNCQRVSRNQ